MSILATTTKAIDLPHYQTKVDPEEADREALVAAEIDVRDLTPLVSIRQDYTTSNSPCPLLVA